MLMFRLRKLSVLFACLHIYLQCGHSISKLMILLLLDILRMAAGKGGVELALVSVADLEGAVRSPPPKIRKAYVIQR